MSSSEQVEDLSKSVMWGQARSPAVNQPQSSRENLVDNSPAEEDVRMACKCDAALGELKEKTSVSKSSQGKERSERTYLVLHPSERIPMRGISEVLAEGEFCRENSQSIIEDESEKYKAAVLNFENRPALPSSMEFDPMWSPISSQPLRAAMDSSSTNQASTLMSIDVPFALLSPYATPPLKFAERAQIHRSLQF